MIKATIIASFLLLSANFVFCQIEAIVLDSSTQEEIPFVNIWVENENIGTTSNEDGAFFLQVGSGKTLLFSAIGYKTKRIQSDSVHNTVALKPQSTELAEIVIKPRYQSRELSIGTFKKSDIISGFACGTKPWIVARFFEFKENYSETPFLKKIRLNTKCNIAEAKFNIRLLAINEKEEPENYIHQNNLFGRAKKGKRITEVDVSELNIAFPEEGFFIAVEWLILESNKHEDTVRMGDSKKKVWEIRYEPSFGSISCDTNKNGWIFHQGEWRKFPTLDGVVKGYEDKYSLLAVELILTD